MGKTIKYNKETRQKRNTILKNLEKKHKNDYPNAKNLKDIKHHIKATRHVDRHYGKTRIGPIPNELYGGRQKI